MNQRRYFIKIASVTDHTRHQNNQIVMPHLQQDVDVEELRINLALLEAEPQEESRAQSLAAAIALITFGSILWTVLGFVCVHNLTNAYNFKESICYIDEQEEFISNKTCNCIEAPECTSLYPCIRLNAVFQTESEEVEVLRGVLYDTIYDVNSEVGVSYCYSNNLDLALYFCI